MQIISTKLSYRMQSDTLIKESNCPVNPHRGKSAWYLHSLILCNMKSWEIGKVCLHREAYVLETLSLPTNWSNCALYTHDTPSSIIKVRVNGQIYWQKQTNKNYPDHRMSKKTTTRRALTSYIFNIHYKTPYPLKDLIWFSQPSCLTYWCNCNVYSYSSSYSFTPTINKLKTMCVD